jgi:hypothetical protein
MTFQLKVSQENLSQWRGAPHLTVGENEAVKASNFNKERGGIAYHTKDGWKTFDAPISIPLQEAKSKPSAIDYKYFLSHLWPSGQACEGSHIAVGNNGNALVADNAGLWLKTKTTDVVLAIKTDAKKVGNLRKSEAYQKQTKKASDATTAFVNFVDDSKGFFAFAQSLFSLGVDVWSKVKKAQAERWNAIADAFKQEAKWPTWDEIKVGKE